MLKLFVSLNTYLIVLLLLGVFSSLNCVAKDKKASDFFKNPSLERDLLKSLFDKYNRPNAKNKKDRKFFLSGEAGLLITSGNTDTSMVKLAFDSNHELENWSNTYEAQFLERTNTLRQANGDVDVKTTRVEISGQFDYKLIEPNNRLFAYLEYDDNEFNQLKEQAAVVVGYSKVAWKDKKSEFRYSIGPGYSHFVQARSNTRVDEMIVRGTMFYNHIFTEGTRFRQTISAEVGQQITKAKTQSSVTAKIFDKLALKFSVNISYNDSVADKDSVFSTQSSITMVYQFF